MKSLNVLTLFLTLIGTFACMNDQGVEESSKRPNIILIFSDELQYEDIGAYGGTIPTPNIDALARGGLQMMRAYTPAPMCTPSRYSVLTSRYPGRCTYPDFLKANPTDEPYIIGWNTFLDSTAMTLARFLSDNGYVTGMAGKWHLGGQTEMDQFPEFAKDADPADPAVNIKLAAHQAVVKDIVKRSGGFDEANSVIWSNPDVFPVAGLHVHNFPWVSKGALTFIENHAGAERPFFLYLTPTAIHGPNHTESLEADLQYTPQGRVSDLVQYAPDYQKIKTELADWTGGQAHRFVGMQDMDHQIGLVLQKVKELGIEEETIILFMSDHNVEPGKATTYEKGIHIPMIISWPGNIPAASKSEALVSTLDIFPTLVNLLKLEIPEELDGQSFAPLLQTPSANHREFVFAESGLSRMVSNGRYKYITFRYPPATLAKLQSGSLDYAPNYFNLQRQAHSSIAMSRYPGYFAPDQLYDLQEDPYEQKNLVLDSTYTTTLKELKGKLNDHLHSFAHPYPLEETEFMYSESYQKLVNASLAVGTYYIPWLRRDWGKIEWPPSN